MPVVNARKRARASEKGGGAGDFPTRPLFVCDPAVVCPAIQGDRPRHRKHGYAERLKQRGSQSTPARMSMPVRKGPSHRPAGMDLKKWDAFMATYGKE